jgi:hypothetical protein
MQTYNLKNSFLTVFFTALTLCLFTNCQKIEKAKTLNFVSFPDFFNFDIPEPWPKYEEAVDYFLKQVQNENPKFVMVDGDMVGGRWWDSPQCVEINGSIYFSGWARRMNKYGLTYYTAIGDHELGDDPWPKEKRTLIPHFEKAYTDNLKMPLNGPEHKKGLSYFVREGDLLLITVETFEVVNDSMRIQVAGKQLEWVEKTLAEHQDAKFKIVQGHVGLWGTLNARSSSQLMLEKGRESAFYKTLVKYGVDAYFAGEFHDVTVLEDQGIWQIVHGSSWGRKIVNTQDYLVGQIEGNKLHFTLKRIYMNAEGDYMWNVNKPRGPREKVTIDPKTLKEGPEVTGTLTISLKDGVKTYSNISGYFKKAKINTE